MKKNSLPTKFIPPLYWRLVQFIILHAFHELTEITNNYIMLIILCSR